MLQAKRKKKRILRNDKKKNGILAADRTMIVSLHKTGKYLGSAFIYALVMIRCKKVHMGSKLI